MGVTATERPRLARPSRYRGGRPAGGGPTRPSGDGEVRDVRGAVMGAIPLALAGLFANAANVGVTVIIARALSTRAYGASAQLLALYFVVSIPGSALLVGVVRRVSTWRQRGEAHKIEEWIRRVRRAGLLMVAFVAVAGIAGRWLIARELSLPGPSGVAEMLTAAAAWSVLCIDRALLQCGGLYRALAVNVCVEGVCRTVVTLGAVGAGMHQSGVAIGQIAAVVGCVAHARWSIDRHKAAVLGLETAAGVPIPAGSADPAAAQAVPPAQAGAPSTDVTPLSATVAAVAGSPTHTTPLPGGGTAPDGTPTAVPTVAVDASLPPRRLAIEVGAALGALAVLGLLQNIDVLVLGRLRPNESGAYAAISVASKVLVFGAMVLAGFLLPEAANRRHQGQHALHQLGATLAILAVPASLLLVAAAAAPESLLRMAFGPRLTDASAALLPLAAAMTCLGATVLFTHYLLAVGSRQVLIVLGVAAAVAVAMLVAADGRAVPTARADFLVQAVLAAITGIMVLYAARRTAAAA